MFKWATRREVFQKEFYGGPRTIFGRRSVECLANKEVQLINLLFTVKFLSADSRANERKSLGGKFNRNKDLRKRRRNQPNFDTTTHNRHERGNKISEKIRKVKNFTRVGGQTTTMIART